MGRTIILSALLGILILETFGLTDAFAAKGDDKPTKLEKECAKELKNPQKIKPECQLSNSIESIEIEIVELQLVSHEPIPIFGDPDFDVAEIFGDPDFDTLFGDPDFTLFGDPDLIPIFGDPDFTGIFGDPDFDAIFGDPDFLMEELQDKDEDLQFQIDSFFDVFFGVTPDGTRNTPDSFFDIFTDVGATGPDSFFDVFVEIDTRDKDRAADVKALQEQVDMLEEWHLINTGEIAALQGLVESLQNRIAVLETLHGPT